MTPLNNDSSIMGVVIAIIGNSIRIAYFMTIETLSIVELSKLDHSPFRLAPNIAKKKLEIIAKIAQNQLKSSFPQTS